MRKTNIKFILFFITIVLIVSNLYSMDRKKDVALTPGRTSNATIDFIKKNIKLGAYKDIKEKKLKKILIGEWGFYECCTIIFKNNGTFAAYTWEAKGKLKYSGKWDVIKDNTIKFMINGEDKWKECKVKGISFIKNEIMTYDYSLVIELEEIKFETKQLNGTFAGGEINMVFN